MGFVPDQSCAWVVIYAGSCKDPECDTTQHDRLYIVPMIGWFKVVQDGFELRPAVMTSDGSVNDYLDLPAHYKFVAVLQDMEGMIDLAYALYHKRFGVDLRANKPHVDDIGSLPN